jgi:phosphatidylglycerophosphate synthase
MCLAGALCVFLHWFADTLDGELARARQVTSLGFYLDHFGDSVSAALIGWGLFLTVGSHLVIGLVCITLYLLLIINGLIKAELTRTIELPAFGPTEIHLTIILVLVAQIFVDFGQPVSWVSAVADGGWLTRWLGFDRGLTFIDLFGVFFVAGAGVALVIESVGTARVAASLDRA